MGEEDGGSISHVVYHMTNPDWIPNIIWDQVMWNRSCGGKLKLKLMLRLNVKLKLVSLWLVTSCQCEFGIVWTSSDGMLATLNNDNRLGNAFNLLSF